MNRIFNWGVLLGLGFIPVLVSLFMFVFQQKTFEESVSNTEYSSTAIPKGLNERLNCDYPEENNQYDNLVFPMIDPSEVTLKVLPDRTETEYSSVQQESSKISLEAIIGAIGAINSMLMGWYMVIVNNRNKNSLNRKSKYV